MGQGVSKRIAASVMCLLALLIFSVGIINPIGILWGVPLALGVAGILFHTGWLRGFLWFASSMAFLFGGCVWHMGGIAEPFSPSGMATFCAIAFWPLIGCLIGEGIKWRLRQRTEGSVSKEKVALSLLAICGILILSIAVAGFVGLFVLSCL